MHKKEEKNCRQEQLVLSSSIAADSDYREAYRRAILGEKFSFNQTDSQKCKTMHSKMPGMQRTTKLRTSVDNQAMTVYDFRDIFSRYVESLAGARDIPPKSDAKGPKHGARGPSLGPKFGVNISISRKVSMRKIFASKMEKLAAAAAANQKVLVAAVQPTKPTETQKPTTNKKLSELQLSRTFSSHNRSASVKRRFGRYNFILCDPKMEVSQFDQLLSSLLSVDNDTRTKAEEMLEKIEMTQRAELFFQTATSEQIGTEQRSLSLVLLRRLLSNEWEPLWTSWTPDVQTNFKANILQATQAEADNSCRKKLCDLIAEIARNCLDEEGRQTWPEVLQFLHECCNSADATRKEVALNIFEGVPSVFGDQQTHYLAVIKGMLEGSLKFDGSLDVRAAAVRAATCFLCDNDDDAQLLRYFTSLVPLILAVCAQVIQNEEDDDTPLQCLGDLATSTPKMLRNYLSDVSQLCLQTVANTNVDDSMRHSALEVMVSLCESAPAMMRKAGSTFIPGIIQQCLALMVDVEDDEEWAVMDTLDEDDDNNATIGETSLDRIACGLGGKAVFPVCYQIVPQMLSSGESWQHRHAALMALSTIGEGCQKAMQPHMEAIVDSVVASLHDPHPRVRYAACNALGQMASDFAPDFEKKFHAKVLPGLLAVLEDLGHPRVASHAGAAIVNFSEDCPKHIMVAYLDQIMLKLEHVLELTFKTVEPNKKLVLEQVITTIASVADTAEERFIAYYDRVMPCLKYILQNAVQTEFRLMRGKTIECMSLIGLAVGKDKFVNDADEIMQVLLKSQAELGDVEGDDPQTSYMISASARICKLLGKQFAQYLPIVMPAVMKAAEFKPEVTLVDDAEANEMAEDNDWQFVNLGDQSTFGIKTAGLEDKANACAMLVCYAKELKDTFVDYVEPVTQLMVPLLKFYFHDGVRTSASESFPYLLEAASGKGPAAVAQLWSYLFPELLKAIEFEPECDVQSEHMWAMSQCIEYAGAGCLTQEQMASISTLLNKLLEKHFDKANERLKKRKDEDHDEEQESELQNQDEEDNYVLSKISDIMHAMFGTHKEAVLPHFENLYTNIVNLLDDTKTYHLDRQWALCIFDDVVEFGGPGSVKYLPHFLPAFMAGVQDKSAEIRQAAAYGFGIMGMHGGNAYAQACAQSIPLLGQMIEDPESRLTSENISATENAIAAVAKILQYNSSMVDSNVVIPSFISWLPVWDDKEEAPHIYGYFCQLVEGNHPLAVGDNNANLPRILTIIAEAFKRSAFDDSGKDVAARLRNIVRMVKANAELYQAASIHLDEEQRAIMNEF